MKFCVNPGIPRVFQNVCRLTCCTALLNSALSPKLVFPSSSHFPTLINGHYTTSAPLQPACFFQPQSLHHVALGVSILVEADDGSPECQFAIRGGGHTPFKGAAGVQGGVTIDLAMMNETDYNAHTSTVPIMTGARWGDVYKTLKPYGVAVTGGRSDSVGVGGLIIGGGWSYFAPQYGLACDNVVSFEVVLSNGTPTTASPTTNPSLFKALKGSGNNLGVLTRITALVNFTPNLAFDSHVNLVTIWQHNGKNNADFAASGLQCTLGTEDADIFKEFLSLEQSFSALRVMDIYDLMRETAPPVGKRALFLTLTFRNNARVLEKLSVFHEAAVGVVEDAGVKSEDWDIICFLQPFPAILEKVSRKSASGGGNVLGLERMGGEDHLRKSPPVLPLLYYIVSSRVVYLLFLDWTDPADDDLFYDTGYDLIDKLKAYTREIIADSDYIYMNYAGRDQNPLKGYGEENPEWIAAIARKYDPVEVFQRQAPGGFKVSKARL